MTQNEHHHPLRRACIGLLLAAHLLFPCHARAQWWTGWSQQAGLALCIHLDTGGVQLYSPLQTGEPLEVSQWSLRGDTLRIDCKSIGFKTVLTRDGTLWRGYWRQGLMKEGIVFQPADTLYQLRRPQESEWRHTHREETVTADYIDGRGDSVHLEGTLTYPGGEIGCFTPHETIEMFGRGRWPCLVLVSGSGQQNRDEELMHHRPFRVLAHCLADLGIATLRYDDRGVGASTGPLDGATTGLFAEDAEAMLHAARANKRVDTTLLGIGGHSEGALIAQMVAACNKEVAFVVMLAGQGCPGLDVMVQQNEALFRARGVSERLCQVRGSCMRQLFHLPPDATVKDYQAVIASHLATLTPAEADSIELKKGMAYVLKEQLDGSWMREFLALDPAHYLPRVHCPVLALGGDRDCQVLSGPNLQRIKELCPKAKCHELPGLNHLFQHCQTGLPGEYAQIEETFSLEAMQMIARFIHGLE